MKKLVALFFSMQTCIFLTLAHAEQMPFNVTTDLNIHDIEMASDGFKTLYEDFNSAGGKAILIKLIDNPNVSSGAFEESIFSSGLALFVEKYPTKIDPSSNAIFLRDPIVLERLRSLLQSGIPTIILSLKSGINGFVSRPQTTISKALFQGLLASNLLKKAPPCDCFLGITQRMTLDILVHEVQHISDHESTSSAIAISDAIVAADSRTTYQPQLILKYRNFVSEYFAYQTQLKHLQSRINERSTIAFNDQLAIPEEVLFKNYLEEKKVGIRDSARYHGWRLENSLIKLKTDKTSYCHVLEILNKINLPEMPLSDLLAEGFDPSLCN